MAKLISERERQLWALNEQWRAGVASEQIAHLENEYRAQQAKGRLRFTQRNSSQLLLSVCVS